MEREVGGKYKREGTRIHLWLIYVDVGQKPTEYCKAIILQWKINKFLSGHPTCKQLWQKPQKKSMSPCSPGFSEGKFECCYGNSYFKSWRWCCESAALNVPANMENSAVAPGLEKVSFHSSLKEKQCKRMFQLPLNCIHLTASNVFLKIP